jgi:hypothetical protein
MRWRWQLARVREHLDTPRIVELQMFCALMLAGGRMTLVQRAYEDARGSRGARAGRNAQGIRADATAARGRPGGLAWVP